MRPEPGITTATSAAPATWGERRRALRVHLAELSSARTTSALQAAAPSVAARAGGFSRALISAVRGSRWMPLAVHTNDDLDQYAADLRAYVASEVEIPLANLLAETTMVRQRTGMLVLPELLTGRALAPIIEIAGTTGYVGAPVVVRGRALGFVHADRVGQARLVDEDDRRLITAFAGEFSVLYQSAWWRERVADRARRVDEELARASDGLVRLDASAEDPLLSMDAPPVGRVGPQSPTPSSRPNAFLTPREWDVLTHVADGATNRVIAHRLMVSEDTVKTHLRGVMRKLGVTSRASAVAWFANVGRGTR